jgi:hypothetical protein
LPRREAEPGGEIAPRLEHARVRHIPAGGLLGFAAIYGSILFYIAKDRRIARCRKLVDFSLKARSFRDLEPGKKGGESDVVAVLAAVGDIDNARV